MHSNIQNVGMEKIYWLYRSRFLDFWAHGKVSLKWGHWRSDSETHGMVSQLAAAERQGPGHPSHSFLHVGPADHISMGCRWWRHCSTICWANCISALGVDGDMASLPRAAHNSRYGWARKSPPQQTHVVHFASKVEITTDDSGENYTSNY